MKAARVAALAAALVTLGGCSFVNRTFLEGDVASEHTFYGGQQAPTDVTQFEKIGGWGLYLTPSSVAVGPFSAFRGSIPGYDAGTMFPCVQLLLSADVPAGEAGRGGLEDQFKLCVDATRQEAAGQ